MSSTQNLYNQLAFYSLAHQDPAFIHQHVVDAFAAQRCDESSKPISSVFALVGLYLHVEKSFTGRQVQLAHMQLARHRKQWPRLPLPVSRGDITISDVLAVAPGELRDAAIHRWCVSVWAAWSHCRPQIVELVASELDIR
jgi:hypothetical protein